MNTQTPSNQVKYPGFVLCVDAAPIKEIIAPNTLDTKPFWWLNDLGGTHVWEDAVTKPNTERINKHVSLRQRSQLEKDLGYLQFLPYTLVGYKNEHGQVRLSTYFRKKGQGEERLAGAASFGYGGHVEVTDVVWKFNGDIDLQQTLFANLLRELEEELIFIDTRTGEEVSVHTLVPDPSALVPLGFIFDTRNKHNDVGLYHLAVVNLLVLPDHIEVRKREEDHLHGPVMDVDQICEQLESFEGWSEIIVQSHYASKEAVNEALESWKRDNTEAQYHRLARAAGQETTLADNPANVIREAVIGAAISQPAEASFGDAQANT